MASEFPYVIETGAQPETLVASSEDRVSVGAENRLPNVTSTCQSRIPTNGSCQIPIDVKPKRQNQINAKSSRNHEFQKDRIALRDLRVSCNYDQTSHNEANGGRGAAREVEQP